MAIFQANLEHAWSESYDYHDELKLARSLCPLETAKILDVGAGNGDMLRAFGQFYRSCSALDVIENPQCMKVITGDFIKGLLEDEGIASPCAPFDLMTAFDLVEHLYDVRKGFLTLNRLAQTKGFLIIETGDAESTLPSRFGVGAWWYLNLFEHHQVFSKKGLFAAAEAAGFRVISVRRKSHKQTKSWSWKRRLWRGMKSYLYKFHQTAYSTIFSSDSQPTPPFEKDHLLVILQKEREVESGG